MEKTIQDGTKRCDEGVRRFDGSCRPCCFWERRRWAAGPGGVGAPIVPIRWRSAARPTNAATGRPRPARRAQRLKAAADDPEGLRLLARSAARLGRDSSATVLFGRLGPSALQAEDLYLLALSLGQAGRNQSSLQVLERGADADPAHAETLFELTRRYYRSDRLADAARVARELAACPGWESRAEALAGCNPACVERPGRRRRFLAAGARTPPSGGPRGGGALADRAACRVRLGIAPRRPPRRGTGPAPTRPGPGARPGKLLAPEPRRHPAEGLGRGPGRLRAERLLPPEQSDAARAGALRRRRELRPAATPPSSRRSRPRGTRGPSPESRKLADCLCPVPTSPTGSIARSATPCAATPTAGSARRRTRPAGCGMPWSSTRSDRATAG